MNEQAVRLALEVAAILRRQCGIELLAILDDGSDT